MLRLLEQMKKETYIDPHFQFTFRKGGHKGEAYEVDLLVSPIRMTELATTVRLQVSSLEKPYFFYTIGLNTNNELSAVLDESSLIDRNFTKAFIAELGKEDWSFFRMYNRVMRNSDSEAFTDFASLEVDFTGYVDSIEKELRYVTYQDIFPNAKNPSFMYNSELYYIEDEYCISHLTPVSDSALKCMVREPGHIFNWENPKTRFGLLEYENQIFSEYNSEEPFDKAFFAEVKRQLPDLASLVKQRHANLRLVYENYCKRENLHFPTQKVPVNAKTFPTNQYIEPLAAVLSSKIGRNDPCPCGSGKKYKKCCMS